MKAREIRMLSDEEIQTQLDQAYQSLFRLRFDWVSGQVQDSNAFRRIKRDIARMKTILREREIAAEIAAYQAAEGADQVDESEV